jgi:glycosyltransferase involved in cell wall biosynthesis
VKVAILADFPLHVIPGFGEAFRPSGHYATWLPQLAAEFGRATALEAHWIVLSDRVSVAQNVIWQNQNFHVLPTAQSRRASTLFKQDRARIREVLDQIQPDVVHGWGTEDVYALATVSSPFPNFISMQGILSHYMLKARRRPREYFQGLLELYVLWRARRITVESEWGRQCLARRNPRAVISLVEYGVQPDFFDVKWNPDPHRPVAVFVGSLTPIKGIQDLVAAFRSSALSAGELWVIGGGSGHWFEKLRHNTPSNIRWLGRKSIQETAALLGQAWCLTLPTRADTSPNVVKEARVIGLPVVTTPCGGQTQYIENDQNGFLVKPGDIKQLAGTIEKLFCDFDAVKKMGACRHAEQRAWFRPENTAKRFLQIYREFSKQ